MAKHLQGFGTQARRRFFDFTRDIGQYRLYRTYHEWKRNECQREGDTQGGVGDLEAQIRRQLANPAVRRVEGSQRDAGYGGRQGEGQVDHRIDDLAPREGIAHQHPGEQRADDAVDDRGIERSAEAQLQRRQHSRRGDDCPELIPGELRGVHEHRRQWNEHNQAEVHQGVAQRQPEAGYDGGDTTRHKSPWLKTHQCGSGLAREEEESVNIPVTEIPPSRASSLPHVGARFE